MNRAILLFGVLSVAAPCASAQTLVAVDSGRILYTIDKATGAKTQFGTVSSNASTTAGLAYDMATQRIFLTSTGNDSIYTLDLATGNATLIGSYGSTAFVMHGLEFDASTNTLYGVSQHDNGLYIIDQNTGLATLVGTTGLSSFTNLVYDQIFNVLYATNSGADSFYSIDRSTGAATLIGALNGPTNPNGLAFDLWTNTIYLVDNSTDNLYTIDRSTGAATLVGSNGAGNLLGLMSVPGAIHRDAHGCGAATLDAVGVPRLGCTVQLTVGGATVPVLGFGFNIGSIPFCTCTLGHNWSTPVFGGSVPLTIPNLASLAGVNLGVQGVDLFATSGCVAMNLAFTDTLTLAIQ